jgi:N-acylneuraminate cytidylyltransferase
MNIAIIPARGGSKRIPRKNIKNFHGKPIITYSIEAAKESGCFDSIIVSTDDDEIANIALKYGAEVPFIRPKNISHDFSTTVEVIKHGVLWLQKNNKIKIDNVCCIYATAPFISSKSIQIGFTELNRRKFDYAFSATKFSFPIQRAFKLTPNGSAEMLMPENLNTRSQDLIQTYHDAGQFYWGRSEAFLQDKPMFSKYSYPVILPSSLVQDIDTYEDWKSAEDMFQLLKYHT